MDLLGAERLRNGTLVQDVLARITVVSILICNISHVQSRCLKRLFLYHSVESTADLQPSATDDVGRMTELEAPYTRQV